MRNHKLARRSVLRGSGVAIALPLLEAMHGGTTARAAPQKLAPRRLAFFYIPNGVVQTAWNLAEVGKDYQVSPTLKPIESVRENILVVSNLDRIKVAGTDGHAQASTCWLSSAAPDELSPAGYPLKRTIDQIIADKTGSETSFRSLELSCNPYEDNRESIYFDNISWFGHGHVARSLRDPAAVFNRLFRVEEHVNSSSVLDLVMEDAKSLQPRLSKLDQHKLAEYTDAVRTVERQITRVQRRQDDIARLNPTTPIKPWQAMRRDEFIQVMGDLMILALQSDLTRVATLMTGPERWGSPLKVEGWFDKPIQHHSWTHGQHNEGIRKQLERLDLFHLEQFVHLVKKMQAINEGDGTLLDNTAFMLGSGLSSGEHHVCNNLPTVIAGRLGGSIQSGQHVRYAKGTPIANLWRSLAKAMGVDQKSVGDSTGLINEIS
ncbi:MAG: DUF1552 domain-containing protein [Planctomycetaceae bacterium]|nr:DUF1552 domain-containing protein [Planctomycetaceae bacterium]